VGIQLANGLGHVPATPHRNRLAGSEQQERFWSELLSGDGHVVLQARAGTGKSTSCREGMWRLVEVEPDCRMAYVAFNRAIADDFQPNIPSSATASTMHSFGRSAILKAFPDAGEVSKNKAYDIADTLVPRRDFKTRRAKLAAVRIARACKSQLLDGKDPASLERLAACQGIDLRDARTFILNLVPRILEKCRAQPSVYDFDDMIWLPVVLDLPFDHYHVVFVDEAQDLDPAQHALVRRLAGDWSMVVVGDPFQAIYAFRGADSRSMATLAASLGGTRRGLVELPLTMTRRCPWSHVDLARNIVGDFEALPEAPEGELVEDAHPEECLRPGVMALCRTNAPLVSTAYSLVGAGIPVAIQGKDIGDGLARLIEGFDAESVPDLLCQAEHYRAEEIDRLSALQTADSEIENVNDRIGCLIAASEGCDSVATVLEKVRTLFREVDRKRQGECVLLSSIHRAKGRESDEVVILRPDLIPHKMARTPAAIEQEANLAYVAATRSRRLLAFAGAVPSLLKGH
jgi:DNA helicase II / ATP-dependent DNA helicase PcrA